MVTSNKHVCSFLGAVDGFLRQYQMVSVEDVSEETGYSEHDIIEGVKKSTPGCFYNQRFDLVHIDNGYVFRRW
jgi:hypothetical protein